MVGNTVRVDRMTLQSAQGQGQHPLRDAADASAQLVEAHRPIAEQHDDQNAPLVADARQNRRDFGAVAGHMDVTLSKKVPPCGLSRHA